MQAALRARASESPRLRECDRRDRASIRTSCRTLSRLSRNMNRARSIVPNRLPSIGKRQPRTRVKSSAGPPAA